jgi:HlyD family secretion protein
MPNESNAQPKRLSARRKGIIALVLLAAVALTIKLIFFPGSFRYAGTLESTRVDLSSRLSSSIANVTVQEGDHVAQNQELVHFVCDDVKVASDFANSNYERNLKLFKAGTVSPENMDLYKNRKEDADVRLSWCTIRSPINGTVLSRYHEPGEWVTPGTKLLTLANIRDIWAYIYVAQPDVAQLKIGEELIGRLPELGDREFKGKIIKINSEAEFTPKNVQTRNERERLVYGVKVSFLGSNEQEILKPGMTIEIELPKK